MEDKVWRNTRVVLFAGFGCLLCLIALLGYSAYRRSYRIYRDLTSIQDSYRQRAVLLREIESGVYLSAILLRDYLMDPAAETGEVHRQQLLDMRRSIGEKLASLRDLADALDPAQAERLERELEIFWKSLDPVFKWTPERRDALGFAFLKEQVLPRRNALIEITRGIDRLNASSLAQEQAKTSDSWKSYRGYLVWMFCGALFFAVFTAVVSIRSLSNLQKQADEHLRRLEDAEKRLRWLSHELVHTQEEERKLISRELHDEIGQMLTGIRMVFGNAERLRSEDEEDFRRQISEGRHLAEQTLQKVRNLASGLRPSMLDDLGLEPAIKWQAREFSRRSGIPVDFKTDGELEKIPEYMRTCVYRVVQESLTNCARHARAKSVRIDLHGGLTDLCLSVGDDGVGFDPGRTSARGLGLLGIQERVRELGGTVTLDSQPGRGTVLRAVIPMKTEVSA
jgi:signal transduction histidine kinase